MIKTTPKLQWPIELIAEIEVGRKDLLYKEGKINRRSQVGQMSDRSAPYNPVH